MAVDTSNTGPNINTAFEQGENDVSSLVNLYHHNLAMQALEKQYGPTVYDTAAAKAAQENYLNSQIDPLKIQEATRQNNAGNALVSQYGPEAGNPDQQSKEVETQGTINDQQRMAAYRATKMLQSQAGPDGSLPPDAVDRVLTPANAQLFGLDAQHLAPLAAMLKAPGGSSHLDTIEQSLIGPTKISGSPIVAQGPGGQSELLNRDQYGNIVPTPLAPGIVPVSQQRANQGQQNADTGVIRAQTGQENAATNARSQNVRENNSVYGASATAPRPGQPSDAATMAMIQRKGGIDQAIAGAKTDAEAQLYADAYSRSKGLAATGGQQAPAPDPLAHLPPKGRQMAISQAQQIANQGTNLQNTNQILDQVMGQISPYTTGTGSMLKDLPGTAQANLKANLATLKAQGLTSWIQSLKNAQGQTGIGRVLQSEANAASNLYGNMEQDQSAKQLAFHAQLFRRAVNDLYQHSQQAYHAQWGTDAGTALGNPPPAAAPQGGGWGNFRVNP